MQTNAIDAARASDLWANATTLGLQYGVNIIAAIVILTVGFWLARLVRNLIAKTAEKNPKLDKTLFNFLGSIARYAVLAFTFLMVLERFGVKTTSLVAIIGAAGLAVGLALQGTLSNLAAGVMLLLFRPFRVGELIETPDVSGVVKSISLFTTELATPDRRHIVAPNAMLWGVKLTNHSSENVRGVDMRFAVGHGADVATARAALREALDGNRFALKDPPAFVEIEEITDTGVVFLVRPFCKSEHYFDVRYSLPEQVKAAFARHKVPGPDAHRTITVIQQG
jgi:small conductance mechanosensitive channel